MNSPTAVVVGFIGKFPVAGMAYYNHANNGVDEAAAFDNFLWEK